MALLEQNTLPSLAGRDELMKAIAGMTRARELQEDLLEYFEDASQNSPAEAGALRVLINRLMTDHDRAAHNAENLVRDTWRKG